MTREEALEILDRLPTIGEQVDALEMAIEALQKQIPKPVEETHVLRTETHAVRSDTISRQAAIRWVKTECNPYGKPTLDFESGKKVIEHLEHMPSAQPEWIPVTERLPEEDGLYFVTTSKGQVQVHAFSHNGNSKEYWMRCNKAWMPLPESARLEGE